MPPPRSIKDGPFAWVSKAALRRIQDRFAESDKVPVANSVYLALCFFASDVQREEFQAKIAQIASRAGVSYKTALIYLRELEVAGLLGIMRAKVPGTKLDAPSTYTLLPVCSTAIPDCTTDSAVCNRGGESSITESLEELEKNNLKNTRIQSSTGALEKAFSPEVIQRVYETYPKKSSFKLVPSEAREIRKALVALSKIEQNPVEFLLDRIKQYKYKVRGQPPKFIKTLLNYLRDEYYYNVFPLPHSKC